MTHRSLKAARLVSTTPESEDSLAPKTTKNLVDMYRRMQKENPELFLKELRGMEREWMSKRSAVAQDKTELAKSGGSGEVDIGSERCLELVRKFLAGRAKAGG